MGKPFDVARMAFVWMSLHSCAVGDLYCRVGPQACPTGQSSTAIERWMPMPSKTASNPLDFLDKLAADGPVPVRNAAATEQLGLSDDFVDHIFYQALPLIQIRSR